MVTFINFLDYIPTILAINTIEWFKLKTKTNLFTFILPEKNIH